MNKTQKGGGCLSLVALPFFCLAFFMGIDVEDGGTLIERLTPGLFLGSVFFVPGMILWITGRKKAEDHKFLEAVTGLVRTHDRFTVGDMAAKIGKTELECELLIARIAEVDSSIDLVFHRPTREFLHRSRLSGDHNIYDQCDSCGAAVNHQVVFKGEVIHCTHCNTPLGRG